MRVKFTPLSAAAAAARAGDRALNACIALMLILALLYGGYGLLDTLLLYRDASGGSLYQYKPEQGGGVTGTEDDGKTFAELLALYPDVCAWLTVDDTGIDYPVVQGEDNSEYLNMSVEGEFSLSGSIFLDWRNSRDFTDSYSLIYGHHMAGGLMFGSLPEFLEEEYFNSHTTGTLYLPEETYGITWFAALYTDAYDGEVFLPSDGVNAQAVTELAAYLKENAAQYRELGITGEDRIIGLSTCSEATTNGRTLLFGRLETN